MAQLNLPVPTDCSLSNPFKLNVTDVLLTCADGQSFTYHVDATLQAMVDQQHQRVVP